MKLSEAIRIGAKNRPQVKLQYVQAIEDSPHCTMYESCALGAAYEGITGDLSRSQRAILSFLEMNYLPIFKEGDTKHPIKNSFHSVHFIIVDLNDYCHWTREQIADWLESIGY